MVNWNYPINVRIICENFIIKILCYQSTYVCGAVHAGYHTQIVPRCYPSIFPFNSFKSSRTRIELRRDVIFTKSIISFKVAHRKVMYMHMVTWLNKLCGKTDYLVIPAYRLTSIQVSGCYLVARRDRYAAFNTLFQDLSTSRQLGSSDHHVIRRI